MGEQAITKQVYVTNRSNEGITLYVKSEDQQIHIEASLNHQEMQALISFYLGYTPAWEVRRLIEDVWQQHVAVLKRIAGE